MNKSELKAKHAEMKASLEDLLDDGIPAFAKTAAELSEELGVSSYLVASALAPALEEGEWMRGRRKSKAPYLYWLVSGE